jgi:hypothetical protein
MDEQEPPPEEFLDGKKTHDGRPRFLVPGHDEELIPVMELLDACMLTEESEPPMRSLGGWPVEVRAYEPIIGMHELVPEDEGVDVTRLPAPRMPAIVRHNRWSMAFEIERRVAFYKRIETKKGGGVEVPCSLPAKFVTGYLNFNASRLPRVSALATAPIVMPDGQVLATNGLDKKQGVVFRIPPEIAELAPKGRVGEAAVGHAMSFLTDEWLVDVKTDYAGKCVLIALALTIIERPLFGERPAFFVTSGKRGGGKTTAINMVALATIGKRAPAVALGGGTAESDFFLLSARRAAHRVRQHRQRLDAHLSDSGEGLDGGRARGPHLRRVPQRARRMHGADDVHRQ